MPISVSLRNLTKAPSRWARSDVGSVVDGVSLEVVDDQLLGIVGPVGSGKSMLLRLIAGLDKPTSGEISIGGRPMHRAPPRSRNVGFVFKGYALFGQMTAADNIGFGLKMNGVPKKERRHRVRELLELMGLEGLEGRRSNELTAEERYKVAFARSLAPRPNLLLLDRPFGGLNRRYLPGVKADVKRWQRELRLPTILVTENPLDALELADRVAVMREGRMEEIKVSSQASRYGYGGAATRFIGGVTPFSSSADGGSMGHQANPVELAFMPESMNIYPLSNHPPPRSAPVVAAVTGYAFKGRSVRLEVRLGEDGLGAMTAPRRDIPPDLRSSRALVDLSPEPSSTASRNGHMSNNADLPADHNF